MELRECPFCKLKENLVIIQVKPIEYLRDDQNLEAIHCDNCDLTMHHPDKKMMYYRWNLRDTPKHETVEQWVERFKDMPGFISIDLLFHKDDTHITKQEYGRILINTICNELIEKYGKPGGNR
ncbi:MAG: hypothetical protein GY804_11390 [Alphaproteobacteria bacterium]|nr:hypothetical protein [Alphaproteobacteria bacterium]